MVYSRFYLDSTFYMGVSYKVSRTIKPDGKISAIYLRATIAKIMKVTSKISEQFIICFLVRTQEIKNARNNYKLNPRKISELDMENFE